MRRPYGILLLQNLPACRTPVQMGIRCRAEARRYENRKRLGRGPFGYGQDEPRERRRKNSSREDRRKPRAIALEGC
jgi:hypothetical protein